MKKNDLAYREEFLAGRLGIRAKILIYLAILAGFIISTVWMLQGVLFRGLYRGATVAQMQSAVQTQFFLTIGAILLATALVGFTMAKSISEPIIETNLAARELSRSRYTRPPHSGGYREIAELNDTLIRAAEDLGKVEDLQRELIANISHDLRTPLTMINRLNSMVNEVLDFSSLRTGNMELEQADFNLTEEIREIVGRVSKMTAVDGYKVVFEDAEDRTVHGDSRRISQVIYNLLGNALTYTGEDKTVRVLQSDIGSSVQVSISDSGEGIPADELPYIWDRYYRSRENHRRAVIGSGLGLNICRGILEKHEAPYGVRSEPGEGTTFWFRLPVVKNPG